MTREEEIINAANELCNSFRGGKTYKLGFEIGVKWADEHPKSPWISVKVDLPCNHLELICQTEIDEGTETITVFARSKYGDIWSDYMVYKNGKWRWYDFEPAYWMIPPKLPKNRRQNYDKRRISKED